MSFYEVDITFDIEDVAISVIQTVMVDDKLVGDEESFISMLKIGTVSTSLLSDGRLYRFSDMKEVGKVIHTELIYDQALTNFALG